MAITWTGHILITELVADIVDRLDVGMKAWKETWRCFVFVLRLVCWWTEGGALRTSRNEGIKQVTFIHICTTYIYLFLFKLSWV